MAPRTTRVIARTALAFLAVLATTFVAGCSEEGGGFAALDEREMERIVIKDMKALESVRLAGASTEGQDKVTLDLVLTSRGDCTGEITVNDKATISYRQVAGTTYVRGNRAYWQGTAGSAQAAERVLSVVGDKWARLPESGSGLGTFCDIDDFMREFRTDRRAKGTDEEVTTVGEVSEVEGVDAVEVITRKGQETTVTWVAVESPHVVLRVESAGGDQPGSFRLDGFDESVEVAAPAAGEVVDLGSL